MIYQCYYIDLSNKRCEQEQEAYWCSEEHRIAWQNENYGTTEVRGEHQLEITEIQRRLLAIKEKKKQERFKNQQKLL